MQQPFPMLLSLVAVTTAGFTALWKTTSPEIWDLYALCFCWKFTITGLKRALAFFNVERLFASFMFTVNCCSLPSNASRVFCNLNCNHSGATRMQRFLAAGSANVGTATPRPVQCKLILQCVVIFVYS